MLQPCLFVRSFFIRKCARKANRVRPYRYVEIQPRSESPSEELLHLGGRDDVLGLVGGDFVLGEGGGLIGVFDVLRC